MATFFYFLTFIVALVIGFLAFIYIRRYLNPMRLIPGFPLKRPIFGDYIEFVNNDCELIKYLNTDRKKFGCIRTSHLFFGKIRLIVSDPEWIKVCEHWYRTRTTKYQNCPLCIATLCDLYIYVFSTFWQQTAKITDAEIMSVSKIYF